MSRANAKNLMARHCDSFSSERVVLFESIPANRLVTVEPPIFRHMYWDWYYAHIKLAGLIARLSPNDFCQ